MSRLLTTGYETGDVNEAGAPTIAANNAMSVVNSAPTPRAGNYCLKLAITGGGTTWLQTYKGFGLPSPVTDIWLRFAFFIHANGSGETPIAAMLAANAAYQGTLTYTATDGLLRVWRGSISGGTSLAAAGAGFAQDGWHVIEWRTQLLTTTTGNTEVWLDGSRVINYSGDNSDSSATLNVQSVLLGPTNASGVAGNSSNTYMAFDDIAINDTAGSRNNGRPGDGRVVLLVPTGAGSSSVLSRGGTDTGANWSQTSELPPSMTQYVQSAVAADQDLYAMSNVGVAPSAINVVEEVLLAQKSDAGAGSIGPTLKSGPTTNEATVVTLSTSAGYAVGRWETDPNTGLAWTPAALDALEAGVTVR